MYSHSLLAHRSIPLQMLAATDSGHPHQLFSPPGDSPQSYFTPICKPLISDARTPDPAPLINHITSSAVGNCLGSHLSFVQVHQKTTRRVDQDPSQPAALIRDQEGDDVRRVLRPAQPAQRRFIHDPLLIFRGDIAGLVGPR